MGKDNKVELCHWVVAFIDLLGQGDKMREVSHLINSGKEDSAVEKMKGIYLDHKSFYEQFNRSLIENQTDFIESTILLPPNIEEEEYQTIFRRNLKMQVFSDAAMFYLPLIDNGTNQPLSGINTLLSVLGIQMISFLAQRRPFRCGIEVGFGLEMDDGRLIGPAVQNAYELESKRAKHPRIVVGDDLVEYLNNIEQVGLQNGTAIQKKASKTFAKISQSWLGSDIDGETILNYLCSDFLQKLPEEETKKIISMAYKFVDEEQARFRTQKNSRLAIRYACLETYFAAHMKNFQ